MAPDTAGGTASGNWRAAVDAAVQGLGYELVDIEREARGLLRVTIDRVPGRGYAVPGEFVLVEDCEAVTRQLQYLLEVEALPYSRLEVSSPGLDRPLRTEHDYRRFAGQAITLTLKTPFEGRRQWRGTLSLDEADAAAPFKLTFSEGKTEHVLGFAFDEVREARLVPVLDFKGRRTAPPQEPAPEADAAGGN